ncbi:hypothetical protein FB561_2776 [Kribbella amoyensis]|uniref:Uncharacterized protein n=1 Tax=Kribbella amoyensis TaxID=996641 RepID=A0A561BS16_9ACTN|nr:hypothetical protein [Kribbella amoyensis]TWD81656.1 hypothetical protein FB561_2776 [Kribbella amoyensis]
MTTVNNDRTSIHRTTCTAWCSPKHHRFCGSQVCCPHLHTPQAVAVRNNTNGGKR